MGAAVSGIDRASAGARLAAFSRVRTADVDEAAESIGRIFCPHALDRLRHSWPDFHALHNSAAFDGFSVNYVAYGGFLLVRSPRPRPLFLLPIPAPRRAAATDRRHTTPLRPPPGRRFFLPAH